MRVLPLACVLASCLPLHGQGGEAQTAPPAPSHLPPWGSHDVLLVVLDDVGVGDLAPWGVGSDHPATPNLDALVASGVAFSRAYANPLCSPTRGTIQTGRYAFRTGLGNLISTTFALSPDELTIPEVLDRGTAERYAHATIGKWHLGNDGTGGPLSPNLAGYGHANVRAANFIPPEGYFAWMNTTDGVEELVTGYAPTHAVDAALGWIAATEEPWFLHLSFNAAHSPLHVPPEGLYTTDLSGAGGGNERPFFLAMIEALDHELGRLLDAVDPARTTVIVVGDNGTPGPVSAPPLVPVKAKGTVFEGGVRVPLVVRSPLVVEPGRWSDALVNTTDLLATVAELSGADPAVLAGVEHDSRSFLPVLLDPEAEGAREHAYVEIFEPNGAAPTTVRRAIRDARFKLVYERSPKHPHGKTWLYDLEVDPFEGTNLLAGIPTPEVLATKDALLGAMTELLGDAW